MSPHGPIVPGLCGRGVRDSCGVMLLPDTVPSSTLAEGLNPTGVPSVQHETSWDLLALEAHRHSQLAFPLLSLERDGLWE